MPGCLHPKLLSVCQQSYAPPGFDPTAIGWFDGDPGPCGTEVDQALVGRIGNAIVVAYRGTLEPGGTNVKEIIDDWINDAQIRRVPWAGGGAVHEGFFQSHRALWPEVAAAIQQRAAAARPSEIVVTGHSKGGALAVLGATAIRQLPGLNVPIRVVTFAAPRVGDRAFADAYAALSIPTTRYENRADVVPNLPLGSGPQPFVRTVMKRFGLTAPVFGYVGVGEAVIDGPNPIAVVADWMGLAWRLYRTRNLRECGIPLVDAHGLDKVYATMAQAAAAECAGHRHAECQAALG